MSNDDLLIKKIKLSFKESRDLSPPVIQLLVDSLNDQDKYSPLLIETIDRDGFEVITPKRQGLFVYETLSNKPFLSGALGVFSLGAIGLQPSYALPLISLISVSSFASIYYYNYFNQSIDNGYSIIQKGKEDLADFLRSLIGLKKLLSDFPEDLIPVDLKAKNVKAMVSDLIDITGHSIYANLEKSNSIKVKDVILCLEKIKKLYSMGAHQELFFYESMNSKKESRSNDENDDQSSGVLNLGSEPEFSVKEDAISEGIKLAKQLNNSKRPLKKRRKKTRTVSNDKRASKPDQKQASELIAPRSLENDPTESEESANETGFEEYSEPNKAEFSPSEENHDSNSLAKEPDEFIENETENGLEGPGGDMRTREPVLNVHTNEEQEFADALDDMGGDDDFELPEASEELLPNDYDESGLDDILDQLEKGE